MTEPCASSRGCKYVQMMCWRCASERPAATVCSACADVKFDQINCWEGFRFRKAGEFPEGSQRGFQRAIFGAECADDWDQPLPSLGIAD